ncbi:MAG TPA: hypothetical protein VNT79_08010 [Phycisphaerae bacterium]|nr:hypothetical protein [Phycisphaerae bacterium]
MAGVSPQRGGSNATMIGMVVSIVVAVILGGVLIWMVTQQEQLRANAATATSARDKIVKGNDESEAKKLFPSIQVGPGKTLVGEIVRAGRGLMGRVTGDQTDSSQTAMGKLEAAAEKIASAKDDRNAEQLASANGAVGLIEALFGQYTAEREARIKAERSNDKALNGLAEAEETVKKHQQTFEDRLAKLASQVEELQKSKSDFEQLKGEEVQALASKVEATRDELEDAKVTHARQRRQVAETLKEQDLILASQSGALRELRGNVPSNAEPLAVARTAVGKILRILPGDSLCYINLGREDKVTLGMTFSVYSQDERIPADGRGKASIEVKSVDANTSECRVVAAPSPDDPILEGDVVNNIIVGKNRSKKVRFVVVGDFDTDFDGETDVRGREQIVALIQRTGGQVVDEVDAATDYVVLGQPPKGQEVVPPEVTPEPEDEATDEEASDDEEASEDEEASTDEEGSDEEEPASDEEEEPTDEEEPTGDEGEGADDEESGDEEPTEEEPSEEEPGNDEGTDEDENRGDGGNGGAFGMQETVNGIQRQPEIDPTVPAATRRDRTDAERYRDARRRAMYFSVPILTQDQFYNFIGIEGKLSDIRRLQG